jgi:hypothetical protein
MDLSMTAVVPIVAVTMSPLRLSITGISFLIMAFMLASVLSMLVPASTHVHFSKSLTFIYRNRHDPPAS